MAVDWPDPQQFGRKTELRWRQLMVVRGGFLASAWWQLVMDFRCVARGECGGALLNGDKV